MGDPAGIGAEIIAKALPALAARARIVIVGDRWVFNKSCAFVHNRAGFEFIDLKNVDRKQFKYGVISAGCGAASLAYLERAGDLLRRKKIDGLVTAPISKEAIHRAGCRYRGHTEYLAAAAGARHVEMMLLNDRLKFVLATRHIPLSEVSGNLTRENLRRTIGTTRLSLRKLFGLRKERIAVCGVNPHASDNGLIGCEEDRIISPAVASMRRADTILDGPLPADVAIARAYRGEYDCVVALYHDQALIPLKLSDSTGGVNCTLGLPFVRTSPLHGTAFDIAGKNKASADSMIAACRCALQCIRNLRRDSARIS